MDPLVEIIQIIPDIQLDIRYASANNFLGRPVYPSERCFLQKTTAERLKRVQEALREENLGLKIFDGYRPLSVQKIFWEILPEPRFVADPKVGSKHNRGASVDLTLVDARGIELLMPSGFDEFSEKASHSFRGEGEENREKLKKAMMAEGFIPYEEEWWHYDDPDWKNFPLMDLPLPN